ncbi:MAG TPA: diaminopimelate decarboxylase, partial [Polyangiaceae bacterium]|nr:diaminopimelate decarboxylase [Polyangiaceae bacterium]
MSTLRGADGVFTLGGASLESIAAQAGTPTYVYNLDGIAAEARALRAAFDGAEHLVAYAVKANSAGPVVRALAAEGCGADVVSRAELLVALGCGVAPERVVYSGVAKEDRELDAAIACADRGIGAIQIESVEEVARVEARARAAGRKARVSVRVNPSLELAGATHAHIATGHDAAKFGVRREDVAAAVALVEASASLELVGMATHVGSQLRTLQPYVDGARALFELVRALRDAGRVKSLAFVDTGGGIGVDYAGDPAAPALRPAEFVRAARKEQHARRLDDLALYVEPGRALVAAHGVLLARVIQPKVTATARWLLIDAGMNDLLRPALYQARHRIVPLREAPSDGSTASRDTVAWRVVGPVCESSDDFGEHRFGTEPPAAVAILDAGAYGYSMASCYNGRQLPAEVFVSGGRV